MSEILEGLVCLSPELTKPVFLPQMLVRLGGRVWLSQPAISTLGEMRPGRVPGDVFECGEWDMDGPIVFGGPEVLSCWLVLARSHLDG